MDVAVFKTDVAEYLGQAGSIPVRLRQHDPPLHDGAAMLAAVEGRFRIAAVSRVPHLWRYLGPDLPDESRGYALAARLRALETALVESAGLLRSGCVPLGCERLTLSPPRRCP